MEYVIQYFRYRVHNYRVNDFRYLFSIQTNFSYILVFDQIVMTSNKKLFCILNIIVYV